MFVQDSVSCDANRVCHSCPQTWFGACDPEPKLPTDRHSQLHRAGNHHQRHHRDNCNAGITAVRKLVTPPLLPSHGQQLHVMSHDITVTPPSPLASSSPSVGHHHHHYHHQHHHHHHHRRHRRHYHHRLLRPSNHHRQFGLV